MTSKEALEEIRDFRYGKDKLLVCQTEMYDIIDKDLEVLEIFKNCFVILNDELMFSISPKEEEKIKRWLEKK
jgi:hypothetical protein